MWGDCYLGKTKLLRPGKTFLLYETVVAETLELTGDMAVKKPNEYSAQILGTRKYMWVIFTARLACVPAYVAPLFCTGGLQTFSTAPDCCAWSFWSFSFLSSAFLVMQSLSFWTGSPVQRLFHQPIPGDASAQWSSQSLSEGNKPLPL